MTCNGTTYFTVPLCARGFQDENKRSNHSNEENEAANPDNCNLDRQWKKANSSYLVFFEISS